MDERVTPSVLKPSHMIRRISDGDDAKALAHVAIDLRSEVPKFELHCNEEIATDLVAALQASAAKLARPASLTDALGALEWELPIRGYRLDPITPRDFVVRYSLDLASNAIVGEVQAPEELSAEAADFAERMLPRLKAALLAPTANLVEELATHRAALRWDEYAEAIERARGDGLLRLDQGEVIGEILRAPLDSIPLEARVPFAKTRARLAGEGRIRDVEGDIEFLLQASDLPAKERVQFTTMKGTLAAVRGRRETALAIYRDALALPEASVLDRAWLWRNLSLTLDDADPEACRYAELSADAFLQAGEPTEAVMSRIRWVNCVVHHRPSEALDILKDASRMASPLELREKAFGAVLLHRRAAIELRLGRGRDALEHATHAVSLLHGLIGVSAERIACYSTAADAAKGLGDDAAAEEWERLRAEELGRTESGRKRLTVANAVREGDVESIRRARALPSCADDPDVQLTTAITEALWDERRPLSERMSLLEEARERIERGSPRDTSDRALVASAMATVLLQSGDRDRALTQYREVLNHDPLDFLARNNVAAILWQGERWSELDEFLQGQVRRFGRQPKLLYGLGRARLEMGHASDALQLLREAERTSDDERLRPHLRKLIDRALDAGALPMASNVPARRSELTRASLIGFLRESFAHHVAAKNRMSFWRGGRSRDWLERPERLAQSILMAALDGRFGRDALSFQEVAVGAGRMDLYLRSPDGFAVVLELKMLGRRYTETYAFSGDEQLVHYMDNAGTALGVLVIFDARERRWGEDVIDPATVGNRTIEHVFIDVRPQVKMKMPSKGRPKRRAG